jgi:hypothetical protein
MLQLYRVILSALGFLIILGSILGGLMEANGYYGIEFGTFVGIAFNGLVLGGSLIITAEFIQVILSMEDHLDRISRILGAETNASPNEPSPKEHPLMRSNVSNVQSPSKYAPKQQVAAVGSDYTYDVDLSSSGMHTVEVHPLDRVLIRRTPQGSVIAIAVPTQTLTAIARTADFIWIKVRKDLEDNQPLIGWVERDQITSYENLSRLSVVG